jgi:hypothetical protein
MGHFEFEISLFRYRRRILAARGGELAFASSGGIATRL